jgi:hypothetical protein
MPQVCVFSEVRVIGHAEPMQSPSEGGSNDSWKVSSTCACLCAEESPILHGWLHASTLCTCVCAGVLSYTQMHRCVHAAANALMRPNAHRRS